MTGGGQRAARPLPGGAAAAHVELGAARQHHHAVVVAARRAALLVRLDLDVVYVLHACSGNRCQSPAMLALSQRRPGHRRE